MDKDLIFVLVLWWIISAAYVMYTHKKEYTLGFDMIIGAILLGPILALFVKDGGEHEIKKLHIEQEENNRHRRWFRTMGEINRQRTPTWFRTIPPPPPISRGERARLERDEAIRMARERIEPPNRRPNNKEFKFFQK